MRRGVAVVVVSFLLFPGGAFALQSNAPSVISEVITEIEHFFEFLIAPFVTAPVPSAASTAAVASAEPDTSAPPQPAVSGNQFTATSTNDGSVTVETAAPPERTVYLQPQTIERTVVQQVSAPLPNDVVHTSLLTQLLAEFGSQINEKLSAIKAPKSFPQQVAADGNGVFTYDTAAALAGGGGSGSGGGVSLDQVNNIVASAIQSALSAIQNLTANTITATNSTLGSATATTLHVTGATTLDTALTPASGGTGISTAPTYGQLLLGQSNGTYALVSTSSLGITGGGSSASSTLLSDTNTFSGANTFSGVNSFTNPSSNWAGALSGLSASQLIGLGFSTTSATYFITNNQGLAFSTTSANYFLTGAQGLAFSTTSASYFLSQNQGLGFATTSATYFVNSSSTIPKTYAANTFTNTNTFSGSSIFNGALTLGSLNGPLQANGGVVSATSSIGIGYGGTGLTSAPTYGQLLLGQSNGTYTLTSTSSLGLGSGTVSSGTQGQFAFYNANGTTLTATSSLFLAQNGYLGIGTTSPFTNLGVNGTGYFTGNLTAPIVDNGGQVVNVKAYGAKGDGVTDDAAAINSAMTAGAGKSIYFPPGTYFVSTSVHVPSNTMLYGAGQGSVITCPSTGWNLSTTSIYGILDLYHTSNIDIHDLHIMGTKSADQTHTPKLIYFEGATNVSIHDNTLDNSAWEGIWQGGDFTASEYISVVDNRIDNVGYPNSYVGLPAIQMGAIHVLISGNILTNVGTGIGASGQQTIVSNNTIINPVLAGIGTGDGAHPLGMVIENNRIELTPASSNYVTGILLDDGPDGPSADQIIVIGNHIRTTQAPTSYRTTGIWASAPEASIADNVIEFTGSGTGIMLDGTASGSSFNVENNTIRAISETATSDGIAGIPNGSGNTLTVTTSGNRVFGLSRANNSFAYDLNKMGGGTLNITIAGDQADGGLYRYLQEYVNDGSLDNRPIYRTSGFTDASFDTLTVASSTGFSIGSDTFVVNNGSIGIGTTSPGSLFSINNIANFTTATTTYYGTGGINILGGCFSINGNCITGGGGSFINTLSNGGTATTTFYSGGLVFSDGTQLTQAPNSGISTLFWDNSLGRLGIGTSNPGAKLDVKSGAGTIAQFFGSNGYNGVTVSTTTNGYTNLRIADIGGLAMNVVTYPNDLTSSDGYLAATASGLGSGVTLSTPVNADNNYISLRARGDIGFFTNSGSTALNERMRITSAGNVGIGTSSPDMLLTVGSNSPSGSVAHFENSTGSCYINPTTTSLSCSSDARLKANVVPLDSADGLSAVLKLNPVTYNWKTETASTSPHTGFIAQDVQPILPDLVSRGPDGYYSLNYAGLTPYLVKAIQEIATITGTFQHNLIAFLGSASNGLTDLFAGTGHFSDKLCIGSGASVTCVNQQQLAALLSQSAGSNLPGSVTSSGTPEASNSGGLGNGNATTTNAAPTSPTISINGANPATITVGSTYADLGATITGPQADFNLGITTVVDNATSTNGSVQIDTSSPGTHTVLYTITDQNGLTGTAIRTVIVSPAQQTPAPANDNTPSAANDSAARSAASSGAQ